MNKVKRFCVSFYSELSLEQVIEKYSLEENMNPISISVYNTELSTTAYVVFEPIVTHYV